MSGPHISVIIPVFNARSFLEDCLNSLLGQTFKEFEVILINDGSTDNSLEIIRKFAKKDGRIFVIDQENVGPSHARNVGLSVAKGKNILFMDSDDYLLDRHAFKKIYAKRKYDAVIYNIKYEGKNTLYPLKEGAYSPGEKFNEFLSSMVKEEHFNSPCNKLYSKQILDTYSLRFDENVKIGEDLLFNIEYFKHCRSTYYLNDNLYFYRTSNELSVTSTYKNDKYLELMSVNDRLASWAKSTANNELLNTSKYIRIKNILSCSRDLIGKKGLAVNSIITEYKKDNPRIIIRKAGVALLLISLIYSYVDIRIIFFILSNFYPSKHNKLEKERAI